MLTENARTTWNDTYSLCNTHDPAESSEMVVDATDEELWLQSFPVYTAKTRSLFGCVFFIIAGNFQFSHFLHSIVVLTVHTVLAAAAVT